MSAPSLDNEFMRYWQQLSQAQKASLLSVAKQFVETEDELYNTEGTVSIEQYNRELDEAMARIDAGIYYTHEEAMTILQRTVHGK